MQRIQLSRRLAAIAEWIPEDARAADVGTDHGYIPVYLAQTGRARSIIASDIGAGPLAAAKASAELYGAADRIRFVCAPGLAGIKPGEADAVILAGMGGETILQILRDAPWTLDPAVTLLLQPQSKQAELARFLSENGYAAEAARLVRDAGRLYEIWRVRAGTDGVRPDRRMLDAKDPLLPEYLALRLSRARRRERGLVHAKTPDAETLGDVRREIEDLTTMLEETKTWHL